MAHVPFVRVDSSWLSRFRRALRTWYASAARDLPWRRTSDPYAIWISEIMLQQTTVAAVVPYFERFLASFPTVRGLAEADEAAVLRHWEGLGYYSRARNIHKTAGRIVNELGGEFPRELQQLNALPGIGRYTAGAIASFAFDLPAPIVEANTLRLYCRLLGYEGDPRSSAGQKILWDFAGQLVPRTSPGKFNQALMELGAVLCTPVEPQCERCPVKSCCQAFLNGAQSRIPQPARRPVVTDVTEASLAIRRDDGCYLLRQRLPGERWSGLWDFPRFELNGSSGEAVVSQKSRLKSSLRRSLAESAVELTGCEVDVQRLLTEIRHSVTRYRIRLLCFEANLLRERRDRGDSAAPLIWLRPAEFAGLPLSVTGRKLADLLSARETAG